MSDERAGKQSLLVVVANDERGQPSSTKWQQACAVGHSSANAGPSGKSRLPTLRICGWKGLKPATGQASRCSSFLSPPPRINQRRHMDRIEALGNTLSTSPSMTKVYVHPVCVMSPDAPEVAEHFVIRPQGQNVVLNVSEMEAKSERDKR